MTSLTRIALAGLAAVTLAGAAEAMPLATPSAPATPVAKTAVIITKKVVRRRPMVRVIRPRRVIKVIR